MQELEYKALFLLQTVHLSDTLYNKGSLYMYLCNYFDIFANGLAVGEVLGKRGALDTSRADAPVFQCTR